MSLTKKEKLSAQEDQYKFPYHYIPHHTQSGHTRRVRALGWGFEYLCYQTYLIELVRKLEPESVLEVGCGDGYFIGALGNGIENRVGADFSNKAIGFARAFHPEVNFHVGDAADIDEQFDVVTAVEVLEHVPEDQVKTFLQVLFERAQPGGYVIISVPSVVLPLNEKHFRHYTAELLREQVRDACPNAEVISEEYVCHVPRWMQLYNKLTVNRRWVVEITALSSRVWRRLWTKHRIAGPFKGRHVVGVFRKPGQDNSDG